ncbi:MAG: DUF1638 domain-containing protein [Methermicoccaceae archaeon]
MSRVLGIIACRMLEDELVHVLSSDELLGGVLVVESDNARGLAQKLASSELAVRVEPRNALEKALDTMRGQLVVVVDVLELALHNDPKLLKEVVYERIEDMAVLSDAILLFYGLCGDSLAHVEHDLEWTGCPIFILRDESGCIADDCIGAALGGRDPYLQTLKRFGEVGTFFLTPMWAANWREMLRKSQITPDPEDISMSRFVFEYVGYRNAAMVDTHLSDRERFEHDAREFAELFDFNLIELEGTTTLVEHSYRRARDAVLGAREQPPQHSNIY